MIARRRWTTPLAGGLLLGTMLTLGCEDENAAARAETQQTITAAAEAYALAAATNARPASDEHQQRLQAVVTKVKNVSGEPGQTGAARTMQSAASREIASLYLARAAGLQSAHARTRSELAQRITTVEAIVADAAAADAKNGAAELAMLDQQLADAQVDLRELQAGRAELEGQMTPLREANDTDTAQADQMESEENDLRRQAREKGAADGYPDFERAVEISEAVNRLRYEVDRRQNTLNALEPIAGLIDERINETNSWIRQIGETRQGIQNMAAGFAAQARELRTEADTLRSDVTARLRDLDASFGGDQPGELQYLYTQAMTNLDAARGAISKAAGQLDRDGRSAAKLAEAAVHQTRAGVYASMARGLESQASLLRRIAGANGAAGSVGDATSRLGALEAAYNDAITKATEALDESINGFQAQASGRDSETILGIVDTLQAAKDALGGADFSVPAASSAGSAPMMPLQSGGAGSDAGDVPDK